MIQFNCIQSPNRESFKNYVQWQVSWLVLTFDGLPIPIHQGQWQEDVKVLL